MRAFDHINAIDALINKTKEAMDAPWSPFDTARSEGDEQRTKTLRRLCSQSRRARGALWSSWQRS